MIAVICAMLGGAIILTVVAVAVLGWAGLIDLLAQELPVPEDVDQIADWRALLEEPEEHAQMRATWAACGPQGPDPDALQAALVRHSDAICERLLT